MSADILIYTQKKRVDDTKQDESDVPGEKDIVSFDTEEEEDEYFHDPFTKRLGTCLTPYCL